MPQTILLLLFGDLGDTILTVPAVRALRTRYPAARLVLAAKPTAASYLQQLSLVDAVLELDKHAFDRLSSLRHPRALWSLVSLFRALRRERPDTVVLFHHLVTRWGALKFALLTIASGAKRRVGLDNGRGWFLTDRVHDRGFGARHEMEYWLAVAGLLDAAGSQDLEAPISQLDRQFSRQALGPVLARGKQCVAIHPGTGWFGPGRLWPAERFTEVAVRLEQECGLACLIVGSGQDADAARVVGEALESPLDLVDRTTTGQLAAVLERCSLLIANDGGVAHLAAAVGTPVVAIFGPSNDRAWRPLTGTVVAVDLPCRPCLYRDHETGLPFGCASRECMTLVTPDMVVEAAMRIVRGDEIAS